MQSLHNHNDRRVWLVIGSAFHCLREPVDDVLAHSVAIALASFMRIVNNDSPAKVIAHLASAVTCDCAICTSCIDNPALRRAELILGVAVGLRATAPKIAQSLLLLGLQLELHDPIPQLKP